MRVSFSSLVSTISSSFFLYEKKLESWCTTLEARQLQHLNVNLNVVSIKENANGNENIGA